MQTIHVEFERELSGRSRDGGLMCVWLRGNEVISFFVVLGAKEVFDVLFLELFEVTILVSDKVDITVGIEFM